MSLDLRNLKPGMLIYNKRAESHWSLDRNHRWDTVWPDRELIMILALPEKGSYFVWPVLYKDQTYTLTVFVYGRYFVVNGLYEA